MFEQFAYEAVLNLLASGYRAALALIGIIIGTASVIAMINVGEIVEQKSLDELNALGPDLFTLTIEKSSNSDKGLDTNSIRVIKERVDGLRVLAPMINITNGIEAKGYTDPAFIVGTNESINELANLHLASGRFLSRFDGAEPFLVVGSDVFADDPTRPRITLRVGDVVRIGSSLFTVIGVLKPLDRNPLLPVDPNSSVFITTSAAKRVSGAVSIDTLGGRISPGYELEAVGSRLESEIAKVLPNAHFRIATAKELIDTIRQQSALFTMLLGAIGSISLIVGGVGVMNIMLVSVVERQREIGLRLSIGARRRDIAIMFLVEASILSMVGGLIGFVLGVAASYGFSWYSEAKFFVSEVALLLGVAVSLLIGIFFGYYPARRAASLDPVAALRSE